MAALAAKDSYIQNLAKRVCTQQSETRKKILAFRDQSSEEPVKPKKTKRPRKRAGRERGSPNVQPVAKVRKYSTTDGESQSISDITGRGMNSSSFSAVDILRRRLHEKIEEGRGLGSCKGLSQEERDLKRQRRKKERERKKRKRKEMRKKEKLTEEDQAPENIPAAALAVQKKTVKCSDTSDMVFNKVEVSGEEPSKGPQQKKEKKKQNLKGNLTPLTGKNYKQLLSRIEARKNKLEELKGKDKKKAHMLETKMKWTNVLYKAEGVKIKDNEIMLKAALQRKEKYKLQRKKQWEKKTEYTASVMQQQQDKRRKNIQKRNKAKVEKKKERARKKGRILPEDLKKANLK